MLRAGKMVYEYRLSQLCPGSFFFFFFFFFFALAVVPLYPLLPPLRGPI